MKNRVLLLLLVTASILGITSCDNNTSGGLTRITYYPKLEVQGDDVVFVAMGSTYTDAGCTAILNGEDVTDQIITTNPVDESTAGKYTVSYKAINADGFEVTASRTVYVADETPSIIPNGIHSIADGTQRLWLSSGAIVPFSGYDIVILQTAPGEFYISDYMGGYYDQRAGYGSNYAMSGNFKLNADNTITAVDSYVPGWGDSMDYLNDGKVDPATGQISYKLGYAGLMEYSIIIN